MNAGHRSVRVQGRLRCALLARTRSWLAVALLAFPSIAGGTHETVVTRSVPLTSTNWASANILVPRVDPAIARLVEVRVRLTVSALQMVSVESLNLTPVGGVAYVGMFQVLASGVAGPLAVHNGTIITDSFDLAPHDGTTDFAGPSGFSVQLSFDAPPIESTFYPGDPNANSFVGMAGNPGQAVLGISSASAGSLNQFNNMSVLAPSAMTSATLTVTVVYDVIDCNNNGVGDDIDILGGQSVDCDGNGFPDECQGDHDRDSFADACDPDCAGPGPDADGDGLLDVCDIITDCDNDGIPDAFEVDRNHNGLTDTCEFGLDCNANGLPDNLDLQAGLSIDGDQNGVPDECQSSALGFFLDGECQMTVLCSARPNTTGTAATLEAIGSCRLSTNGLALHASRLPPGRLALFFEGRVGPPTFTSFGLRCVTGPLRRLGAVTASPQGTAHIPLDLASAVTSGAIAAWDARGYQVLFRDGPLHAPAPGLSDGLFIRYLP